MSMPSFLLLDSLTLCSQLTHGSFFPALRLSEVRLRLAEASADYERRVMDAAMAGSKRDLPPTLSEEAKQGIVLRHLERIPPLHRVVWTPFPEDAPARRRRIHLLQLGRALGLGTFGIVFAVAIEQQHQAREEEEEEEQSGGDDPWVVLAAMKMMPILKHHGQELTNAMAANDLVRAGCTPSVLRLMDAFCITTVSQVTRCEMPPCEWDHGFWHEYDRFVYDRAQALIDTYGSSILWGAPDHVHRTARVNAGAPVGFLFTELSLGFLVANVGAGHVVSTSTSPVPSAPSLLSSSGQLKRFSPSLLPTPFTLKQPPLNAGGDASASMADTITSAMEWFEQFSQGLLDTVALASHCYQRLQAVDALHASRLLHRDIHHQNWLFSPSAAFRSAHCVLETREGRAVRSETFGWPGRERPDDLAIGAQSDMLFRQGETEDDRTVIAIPVARYGISSMIDLGTAATPTFEEGMATNAADMARYFFGIANKDDRRIPLLMAQLPDFRTFSQATEEDYERARTPAFAVLTAPTTSMYNRCSEQLNPYVIRHLVARPEFPAGTHYLAFHSEPSDVYSVAVDQCQLILGYNIFGTTMRASTVSSSSSSDAARQSIAGRSRGPRLVRIRPPSKTPSSSGGTTYELFNSYLKTRVYPIAAARLASSSGGGATAAGAGGPLAAATTDWNDESGIFKCAFDYECGPLMEYILVKLLAEHKERGAPRKTCEFFGSSDQELSEVCLGLLRRLDAVGLPANLDSLRGTFFYNYLADAKHVPRQPTASPRARGWLYPALHETMTCKWAIPKALATDWAMRLVAALSLDPAERPSLQRLMHCSVFPHYLSVPRERLAASVPNILTLWSSLRPSNANGGIVNGGGKGLASSSSSSPPIGFGQREMNLDQFYANFMQPPLTKDGVGALFALERSQATRDRFSFIHWSLTACLHVARLRFFRSEYCRIAGFLLQYHRSLPRLMPTESALAALYNYKTGALDFFSGAVCVEMGRNKREALVLLAHQEAQFFPNLHFRDEASRDAYVRWAAYIMIGNTDDDATAAAAADNVDDRGRQFPAWPFALLEDAQDANARGEKRPRGEDEKAEAAPDEKKEHKRRPVAAPAAPLDANGSRAQSSSQPPPKRKRVE